MKQQVFEKLLKRQTYLMDRLNGEDWLEKYPHSKYAGPILRDEALLLYAFVNVVRPRHILEIGAHMGHSTRCLLKTKPETMTTVDIEITNELKELVKEFPELNVINKSQTDISVEDLPNPTMDLCFLDASHELELNVVTLHKLLDQKILNDGAYLIQHDTGTIIKYNKHNKDAELHVKHQPGEWEFRNYIAKTFPSWQMLDVFMTNSIYRSEDQRDGMTIYKLVL